MKAIVSRLAAVFAASVILSSAAVAFEFVQLGEAVIRLGPYTGRPTMVEPEAGFTARRRTATFAVTYNNFTPAAKAAFQRAVNIWAGKITSSVTIRVRAQWANLGSTGILGSAGPTNFLGCSSCPPGIVPNTWYPVVLANKIVRQDLDTTNVDISARFNNTFTAWFFGTGQTPAGKINFTSVVLHELGHGLGFVGSGALVQGNTKGTVRGLGGGRPTIYDRFTVNGANKKLITFNDPSAALKNQLLSNNLFFRLNSGVRYKIFAPAVFQPGSSYSHLNEATFPAGNVNSLMTPSISRGETILNPGPATLAIFKQMGWN